MSDEFATTKLMVEVTVRTQFGHQSAMELVRHRLHCPAVEEVKIIGAKSNFRLHKPLSDTLVDVPLKRGT